MSDITRAEHLEWCKRRALEYVDRGDLDQALTSMMSDLQKHPETVNHAGCYITVGMMLSGQLKNADAVRRHIKGFN